MLTVKAKIFESLRKDVYQKYSSAEGYTEHIILTQETLLESSGLSVSL